MRLIDADALHKFVDDKVAEGKDGWVNGVPYEWAYALTAVDMQPTIDAVPVKRGRWVEASGGRIICNRCGNYPLYDYHGRQKFSPVCWNCGARMGGEEDGKGD